MSDLAKQFADKSGWTRTSYEIDAWWFPEPGKELKGKIVGHRVFKTRNGDRLIYLIQTGFPVVAKPASGDLQEAPREFPADSIIAVGESYALRDMRPYVEKQGLVMLRVKEKVKLKDGQTMWKYDSVFKGEKTAFNMSASKLPDMPTPQNSPPEEPVQIDNSDIPF